MTNVITESIYWRRDLFRAAAQIRKKSLQQTWRDASFYQLEKNLAIGAFGARRLIEAGKVPANVVHRQVPCVEMKLQGGTNLRRIRYSLAVDILDTVEMYDFGGAVCSSLPLRNMTNQLIHSSILIHLTPQSAGMSESALLVCSDRERKKRIFGFWLYDVALAYDMVSITEPSRTTWTWSDKHDDFIKEAHEATLDDRLVYWGYATKEEIAVAKRRIDSPRTAPSLDIALRQLGADIAALDSVEIEVG